MQVQQEQNEMNDGFCPAHAPTLNRTKGCVNFAFIHHQRRAISLFKPNFLSTARLKVEASNLKRGI